MSNRDVRAFSVKVSLNELVLDNPAEHRDGLAQVERLAFDSEGFLRGATAESLYGHAHFLGHFSEKPYAIAYLSKVVDLPYVGSAALEPQDGRSILKQMPPAELMEFPERVYLMQMAALQRESARRESESVTMPERPDPEIPF